MTKSSEHIEQEINSIRDRMRNRIDSAAHELSPRAIAARVIGKEDPSMTELLDWAVSKARNNPVATSLIAAGVASLAVQSNGRTRSATRQGITSGGERVKGYAGEAAAAARGYMHDAADIAVEKADDAAHYLRQGASSASRSLSRSAREAEHAARYAADRSVDIGREGTEWVKRNPTATGLFALAIGAAAASVFAARQREDVVLKRIGISTDDDDGDDRRSARPARRTPPRPAKKAASAATKTPAARKAAAPKRTAAATSAKPKTPRAAAKKRAASNANSAPNVSSTPKSPSTTSAVSSPASTASTATTTTRDGQVH